MCWLRDFAVACVLAGSTSSRLVQSVSHSAKCLVSKQQSGGSIAFCGMLKLLATMGNCLLVGVLKVILATTTAMLY